MTVYIIAVIAQAYGDIDRSIDSNDKGDSATKGRVSFGLQASLYPVEEMTVRAALRDATRTATEKDTLQSSVLKLTESAKRGHGGSIGQPEPSNVGDAGERRAWAGMARL